MFEDTRVTRSLTSMVQSSVRNIFIRGSVVRYVHLPGSAVDTGLLEDATRRGQFARVNRIAGQSLMSSSEAAQASAKAKQG